MQSQLIEDLLDVSRIILGKMRLDVQPMDATEVIESAIESVRPAARAKELELLTVLDPRVGTINGDATRLQQVVWNLLANAVKFTPQGGQVRVAMTRLNGHLPDCD